MRGRLQTPFRSHPDRKPHHFSPNPSQIHEPRLLCRARHGDGILVVVCLIKFCKGRNDLLTYFRIDRLLLLGKVRHSKADCQPCKAARSSAELGCCASRVGNCVNELGLWVGRAWTIEFGRIHFGRAPPARAFGFRPGVHQTHVGIKVEEVDNSIPLVSSRITQEISPPLVDICR